MSKHMIATCAAVFVSALESDVPRAESPTEFDNCAQTVRRTMARACDTRTTAAPCTATHNAAAPIASRSVADSIVPQLLSWIARHTKLRYDPERGIPEVRSVGETDLVDLFLKEAPPADLSAVDMRSAARQIAALYHHDTRTIYLHRTVDTGSTQGKGAIVHELVHFVQYQLGLDRQVECTRALEQDAYRVQAMYLRAHGAEPGFDAFTVAARSFCDPAAQ